MMLELVQSKDELEGSCTVTVGLLETLEDEEDELV